jgi:surface polysaccharide O-acyltransferase-like enzyme
VDTLLFEVIAAFPVPVFVFLSFLSLAPRLQAGVSTLQIVSRAFRRLAPLHLFWAFAYLFMHAAWERHFPSLQPLVEAVLLGSSAAHLYFTPMLFLLTACAPVLYRYARFPATAVAAGLAMALAEFVLHNTLGTGNRWVGMFIGVLQMAPFALAGLACASYWRAGAPSRSQSPAIAALAGAMVFVAVLVLVDAALRDPSGRIPPSAAACVSRLGLGLGVCLLLVSAGGWIPMRLIRLAPYALGVYFIHPVFIKMLQGLEGHVRRLAGLEVLLILPNAALCMAASFFVVALLARTPLRLVVGRTWTSAR